MTEQDIRSIKIQPFQVAKVLKLLQREATLGELIKIFERDFGFNVQTGIKRPLPATSRRLLPRVFI